MKHCPQKECSEEFIFDIVAVSAIQTLVKEEVYPFILFYTVNLCLGGHFFDFPENPTILLERSDISGKN